MANFETINQMPINCTDMSQPKNRDICSYFLSIEMNLNTDLFSLFFFVVVSLIFDAKLSNVHEMNVDEHFDSK